MDNKSAGDLPPDIGDIETIGWDGYPGGELVRFEDHRAYVTRLGVDVDKGKLAHRLAMEDNIKLQAEVYDYKAGQGRYEDLCDANRAEIRTLQAELTKARELIEKFSDELKRHEHNAYCELGVGDVISNQSAPAAKDDERS